MSQAYICLDAVFHVLDGQRLQLLVELGGKTRMNQRIDARVNKRIGTTGRRTSKLGPE